MFIVLLDEPGLFVFESPTAAADHIEPPDAENEVRAAFDEGAVPYRVEWIRPNISRSWVAGNLGTVRFGQYRFVPAGPADPKALTLLLEEHPDYTDPPEAKAELDRLLEKLRPV
jgi:hypothetical protein